MKSRFVILIGIFIIISSPSFAESISFERSRTYSGVKKIINQQLKLLYSSSEDRRSDTLDKLKETANNPEEAGDERFVYVTLGDYLMRLYKPSNGVMDEDLQESALEFLIEQANNSDFKLVKREFAAEEVARTVTGPMSVDLKEEAASTLMEWASGDNIILANTGFVGLENIAIDSSASLDDVRNDVLENMADGLSHSSYEIRRTAFITTIRTLGKIKTESDAVEEAWEALPNALENIASPSLQSLAIQRLDETIQSNRGSAGKYASSVRESLNKLKSARAFSNESFAEALESAKSNTGAAEVEASLTQISKAGTQDFSDDLYSHAMLAEFINHAENDYKLRLLCETIVGMTQRKMKSRSHTSLFFYDTAITLLEAAVAHQNQARSIIPLFILNTELMTAKEPVLVAPVLEVIKQLLKSKLSMLVQRRLVAILYIQAGEASEAKVRRLALKHLWEVGRKSPSRVIQWEIGERMSQLSQFSRDPYIKSQTRKWR